MKILCLILIVAAASGNFTQKRPADDHMNNHVLNYLALGDSYTIGESVPADQSYPAILADELNRHKQTVNKPTIIATTGWTTDELIDAVSHSQIDNKKFDLVTLLIGVNDQYRGLSVDNYKVKFRQVLNTAIHFANGNKSHVFVLSIPDYGVTPFGKENEAAICLQIDKFNTINKQISLAAGVNYLDITPISRQAKNEPELVAADGLHPSGKMYARWVNLLEPMVAAKLNLN
jgi:lysophospholipase L1-like esterase